MIRQTLFAVGAVVTWLSYATTAAAAPPPVQGGNGVIPEAPALVAGSISAGDAHTCAVAKSGALVCWGSDYRGMSSPPNGKFTSVSTGYDHSCAIRTSGSIACWGDNAAGQASPPSGMFF